MIRYYTSREIADRLKINLARWKRWSRAFLPPDPLGGQQSGYARQYLFKDLFSVVLGGHLLSLPRLPMTQSQQVLADLTPWLKKNGYLQGPGNGNGNGVEDPVGIDCQVYFWPKPRSRPSADILFDYIIRQTLAVECKADGKKRRVVLTCRDTHLSGESVSDGWLPAEPELRLIPLSALYRQVIDRMETGSR